MLASYETATFTVLYRGYDIEVSRAPGERVSTRAVLICRSFAAAKFKLVIRMRRSSRPWIAWMEYFGSRCWPLWRR